MKLTAKYLNFATRLNKEFWPGFLIVTSIIMLSYFVSGQENFLKFGLVASGFALVYGVRAFSNAKTFVNEVEFTDNKLIAKGYNYNSRWERRFEIRRSEIKIKSKGRGRGKVEYYLSITSGEDKVRINRSFNWDYTDLLTIFNEFKKVKGEKVIADERYFLRIMEGKSKGLSETDIYLENIK